MQGSQAPWTDPHTQPGAPLSSSQVSAGVDGVTSGMSQVVVLLRRALARAPWHSAQRALCPLPAARAPAPLGLAHVWRPTPGCAPPPPPLLPTHMTPTLLYITQLRFVEGFGEGEYEEAGPVHEGAPPEWACSYCGVREAACVAKCLQTGKWFCNGRQVRGQPRWRCALLVRSAVRSLQRQWHGPLPAGDAHAPRLPRPPRPPPGLLRQLPAGAPGQGPGPGGAAAQGQPPGGRGARVLRQRHAQRLCPGLCARAGAEPPRLGGPRRRGAWAATGRGSTVSLTACACPAPPPNTHTPLPTPTAPRTAPDPLSNEQSGNTVVLLARDTPPNHPAIRDLGLDLAHWSPVIEDRQFVPWLIREPADADRMRARRLTPAQASAPVLLWRPGKGPHRGLGDGRGAMSARGWSHC